MYFRNRWFSEISSRLMKDTTYGGRAPSCLAIIGKVFRKGTAIARLKGQAVVVPARGAARSINSSCRAALPQKAGSRCVRSTLLSDGLTPDMLLDAVTLGLGWSIEVPAILH